MEINNQIKLSITDNLNSKNSNTYLIIRVIFGTYSWMITLYSMYWAYIPKFDTIYDPSYCCLQYWPFYFSHWGLALVSLYWFLIIYLNFKVNYGSSVSSSCDSIMIFLMRTTYTTGLVFSIVIMPVFWGFVYHSQTDIEYLILNINQHGITMILILIEWFLNMLNIKWKHIFFVIVIGLCYIGLMVIHYLINMRTEHGKKYLYSFVNFVIWDGMAFIIITHHHHHHHPTPPESIYCFICYFIKWLYCVCSIEIN
eukprot:375717_1